MSTATRAPGLVYWLPLDEAARRFAVSREDLTAAARSGDLDVRAKVIGGEVVASVSSRELTTRYGPPRTASIVPLERREVPPAPDTETELQKVHGRLVAAEDRARVLELDRARLEGRLETADRLERGLQRYTDRLEERLDETRERYEAQLAKAETVRLQLARVVGRMEVEMGRMQQRIDELEGEKLTALPAAPERPKRRRFWPFG